MKWVLALVILLSLVPVLHATDTTEAKVKTVYEASGRPVDQSQTSKGFHTLRMSLKLSGGRGQILLNTSTANGKQDVSFKDRYSFKGQVAISDTSNTKTYKVVPISGAKIYVLSSDITDTSTVTVWLEGN